MSWFTKASLTQYAQEALNQAQASIDKALEIEPTQDPLSVGTSGRKPSTPPTRRAAEKKEADDWASWSASAVNSLWEGSFTTSHSASKTTPSSGNRSNAMKLSGSRKSAKARNSGKTLNKRADVFYKGDSSPDLSLKKEVPQSAIMTGEVADDTSLTSEEVKEITKSSSATTLKPVISSESLIESHDALELFAPDAKDQLTPTLSSSMLRSTSSNGSDQSMNASVCTVTGETVPMTTPAVNEEEGWSEEEEVMERRSSDSRSSLDTADHKRCLSIGSTTSSSILMLQSPHESSDKSDEKSDEDNTKTNIPLLQPAPRLDVTHESISEEVVKPTPIISSRIVTSPTHSEQSDMVVLNTEDGQSPDRTEMTKLKEVLHAREQRLFKMNQEYVEVQDELQNERQRCSVLQQNLNILSQKHSISVEQLEEELGAMEDLKNALEGELQSLKELGDVESLRREIEEKDQTIVELTAEGEKLAQSSFNSANNVKKLRQKEKEDEKIIREKSDKIETLTASIEELKSKISSLENLVSEGSQNIADLNSIIKTQSQDLADTKAKLESTEAENNSLKQKIDGYIGQVAELKEQKSEAESRANKESLSANIKAREEAQATLAEMKAVSESTIRQQSNQIRDLQEEIARLEQQAVWREQRYRDQTQELHSRVEDADGRSQDISTSITASTQPLLRQIQLYKESLASQQSSWEKVECDLNEKLNKVRADLSHVEMEKRDLADKLQVSKNKAVSYQTQLDALRTERNELEVAVEVANSNLVLIEEERRKDTAKSDKFKSQFLQSLEDSRAECEQLREKLQQSMLREHTESSVVSEGEDIASRSSTPPPIETQTMILEKSLYGGHQGSVVLAASPIIAVQQPQQHVFSYGMEKLQSQLKQSQSEMISYQEQVRSLTLSKASLSTEITRISERCSQLELQCERMPALRKEKMELQTRYDTLLAMYGEKMEEVNELQLDLSDVKEAYKAQIEQLLAKVIK